MLTRKSIQTLKISHFCILWISSKWFIFNIFVSSCCYLSSNFLLPIFLFFFFLFSPPPCRLLPPLPSFIYIVVPQCALGLVPGPGQSSVSLVRYLWSHFQGSISEAKRAHCACHTLFSSLSSPTLDYPLFTQPFFLLVVSIFLISLAINQPL